jgi:predicted ester cyclase
MGGMEDAKTLVAAFLETVRSGREPEAAGRFMAPAVLAHQVVSEDRVTVERTPAQYAEHVRDMLTAWGTFEFRVDELIAEADRVYARWTQTGRHLGEVDGYAPTAEPVVEVASAVYRVEDGAIVEYWIQIDRFGIEAQLRRNGGG